MTPSRTVTPVRPARQGVQDGLSYALWLPADAVGTVTAGVVVLHGAGSCKENHYDFARAAIALGIAALSFDQRGHGESDGRLDGRAVDDVVAMADLLVSELGAADAAVALRGSSMGGYLAVRAAERSGARAVVAICPASGAGLRRGLHDETLHFDADVPELEMLLESAELGPIVERLDIPILLLHAQGDEQVAVQHSRELAASLRSPQSRLIEVPAGHHRSIQHDEELQAVSLRFVARALGLR